MTGPTKLTRSAPLTPRQISDPVLRVRDLSLSISSHAIVKGVSFDIEAGEAVGLVGESGSGKSLTARSVIRLVPAGSQLSGSVHLGDSNVLELSPQELRRLRATDVAMIFQDPRAYMNPVRTIGDHLTEPMRAIHGLSAGAAKRRALELLDIVRVDSGGSRLRQYPHELSGGLLQRVMIAGALSGEPKLLIADEPTTALDVTTQSDVMATLLDLRRERNVSLLFITHDLELAAATCDRTMVMYAGRVVEQRPSVLLDEHPAHPYTMGLLNARPRLDAPGAELIQLPGRPGEVAEHNGCAFEPRCVMAIDICRSKAPAPIDVPGGTATCHRTADVLLMPDLPSSQNAQSNSGAINV